MNKGLVHIYYGDGKGKTTAALGLVLRQLSYNKKVLLVQFMKKPQEQFLQFGEISFFKKQKNISIKQFGSVDWVFKNKVTQKAISEVNEALLFLKNSLNSKKYDLIVADELLYTIDLGILNENKISDLIKSKPDKIELILTGSHKKHKKLIELADYVSHIKKIKHPFDKGIIARKSIEF